MKTDLFKAFATRRNKELSAMLSQLPNPDSVLRKKGLTVSAYDDLLYDAHLSSCVQSRKAGVISLEWEITGSPVSAELQNMIEELNIYQIITDILEAPLYGFKPLEVYWRYDNNKLTVKDVIGKPVDWFVYDDLNLLKFLHKDFKDGVMAPAYKIIVAKHNASYLNPYGQSILSRCFWAWFVKKEVFKFWTKYSEKYGMPYTVGYMEGAPEQEQLDEFSKALDALLQDGTLALPEGKRVDSFQTNQTSAAESYEKLINFCNAEISKSILSQTLTTEQGDKGTQALGTVHLQVRKDVVDSDKKLVESVFNKIIRWYCDLNYGNIQAPRFVMYEEDNVDQNLATRDKTLADTKQIEFTAVYWQRKYGFKEDEFKIPVKAPETNLFAEKEPDEYKSLSMFEQSVETLLKPIIKEVKAAKSFDEIQEKCIELFPYLDTEEIEELIAQGILASSIQGIIDGGKFSKAPSFDEFLPDAVFDVAPKEALKNIKKRGEKFIPTSRWDELESEAHNKAFTVSKVMSADILQKIYDEVETAKEEGTSLIDFQNELYDKLLEAGYTGRTKGQLRVIWETNMAMSYSKNQYKQQKTIAEQYPYWLYTQQDKRNKRLSHSQYNGRVFKHDDPIWDSIYPPSAFNCQCFVTALSKNDVESMGLTVENGSNYTNVVKTNKDDFNISPLKAWEPETNKYISAIKKQLEIILSK